MLWISFRLLDMPDDTNRTTHTYSIEFGRVSQYICVIQDNTLNLRFQRINIVEDYAVQYDTTLHEAESPFSLLNVL